MDDEKKELLKIKKNLFVSACPGAGKTKFLLGMLGDKVIPPFLTGQISRIR